MRKKQEKQELFEQELASIKPAKPQPEKKVTRAQISQNRAAMEAEGINEKR